MAHPQAARQVHCAARVRATTGQAAPHSLEDDHGRVKWPHERATFACAHHGCSVCVRSVLERDQRRPTENVLSPRLQGRHFCALGGQRPHARLDNDDHRGNRDLLRLSSRRCGAARTVALALFYPPARPRPTLPNRQICFGARVHSALGRGLWAAPSPNLGAAACRRQAKVDGSWRFAVRPKASSYRGGLPPRA